MDSNQRKKAIEQITSGKLKEVQKGYLEVPTSVFVAKVDVKMPPPPAINYYLFKDNKIELLREAHQRISPLVLSSHPTIIIRDSDFQAIKDFVQTLSQREAAQASNEADPKIKALRNEAILVTEDLFNNPSPDNINRSRKVVGNFVNLLMKDPKAYMSLATLSSHDPYTLQHSVGCAVNSIILGRKLRITNEKDLADLGMGGLLHDIGKIKVKVEIINKEGPLNEVEWEEMREHSAFGYNIIKDNPTLDPRTKLAVLEHHEEVSGKGYPNAMPWNDVALFSKIVGISDIFNALTTNRSYSKARTPFEAFALMRDKLTHKIDQELFRELVRIYGGDLDDLVA